MKIVYFTVDVTGSGHIVTGISIANALKRKKIPCEYTILHSSQFKFFPQDIKECIIPVEDEEALSKENYINSQLYNSLLELKPDILLIELFWFSVHHFIDKLPCKKIFLSRQVEDSFFTIPLKKGTIIFNKEHYNMSISTEPFKSIIPMTPINPIIIRNKDEIFSKEDALDKLGVKGTDPVCLLAYNGKEGEYEKIKRKYSYLKDAGYTMLLF